jgi:hypothetical protein
MTQLVLSLPEAPASLDAAHALDAVLELAERLGWQEDIARPGRWRLGASAWRLRVSAHTTWAYELYAGYYRHRLRVKTTHLYGVQLMLERVAAACQHRGKVDTLHAGHPARH